jgi:hypothetical protein
MKLEIEDDLKHSSPVVRLALRRVHKEVRLVVLDSDGKIAQQGNLMTFEENGRAALHFSVNKDFGFKLTTGGRLDIE